MLSKQEMKFLTDTLKTLVSKMGSENPVRKILRKNPRKSVPREEVLANRIKFFSSQTPPTDYGRYKSPMAG